jgi:hypothetical protein
VCVMTCTPGDKVQVSLCGRYGCVGLGLSRCMGLALSLPHTTVVDPSGCAPGRCVGFALSLPHTTVVDPSGCAPGRCVGFALSLPHTTVVEPGWSLGVLLAGAWALRSTWPLLQACSWQTCPLHQWWSLAVLLAGAWALRSACPLQLWWSLGMSLTAVEPGCAPGRRVGLALSLPLTTAELPVLPSSAGRMRRFRHGVSVYVPSHASAIRIASWRKPP